MIPADPTLEERIRLVSQRLVLIQTAALADPDDTVIEQEDILDAIIEAAEEAHDVLSAVRKANNFSDVSEWKPKRQKGGAR